MDIVNPASGQIIADVEIPKFEQVRDMYHRSRHAARKWANTDVAKRGELIRNFRNLLSDELERAAGILTAEVGKPIGQSRAEIKGTLGRIDWFLENFSGLLSPLCVAEMEGMREEISWEPLGVVANISAWNYPYFVGSNVYIPALLTGNTVLYKPSEFATLSGKKVGELMEAAGIPKDVFQVVCGNGQTGRDLVAQFVDGVFFTGSYPTGKAISEACAERMIKIQMELGGKDAIYVAEDANVEVAAASIAEGVLYNSGQGCCSVERIYVHGAVYEQFMQKFIEEVKNYKVGDPLNEGTFIGPLTRRAQLEVLDNQVADAVAKGAVVALGGRRMEGPGNFYEPTVITHCDHTMKIMKDESFGPICGIAKVESDDRAVYLMNDTMYGLTAGVYSKDRNRAQRILKEVKTGTAYWNCCDRVSPRLPWSGRGHSGVGVTLSKEGISTFLRPKAWHLRSP